MGLKKAQEFNWDYLSVRPNSKLCVSLGTFLELSECLLNQASHPPQGVWQRNKCLHVFQWLPMFPNYLAAGQGHVTSPSQWWMSRNDLCPFQLRQWKTHVWLSHLSLPWSKGLRRPLSSSSDGVYKMVEPLSAWVSEWLCRAEHSLPPPSIPISSWTLNQ